MMRSRMKQQEGEKVLREYVEWKGLVCLHEPQPRLLHCMSVFACVAPPSPLCLWHRPPSSVFV